MLTENHILANTVCTSNKEKFTTIINVDGNVDSVANNAIVRLLRSIAASQSAHSVRTKVEQIIQSENNHYQFQIHVIWSSTSKPRKSYFAKIVKFGAKNGKVGNPEIENEAGQVSEEEKERAFLAAKSSFFVKRA